MPVHGQFYPFELHILFPLAQMLERSHESLQFPILSFKHDFLQKGTSSPVGKAKCYRYWNIKSFFLDFLSMSNHVSISYACFYEKESWDGSKSHDEVTGEVRKVWLFH